MSTFEDCIASIQQAANGEEVRDAIVDALRICRATTVNLSQATLDDVVDRAVALVAAQIASDYQGVIVDSTLSSSSNNPVRNSAITQAIQQLQNATYVAANLTIDDALNSSSTNPVQNSAIATAINNLQSSITVLQSASPNITIDEALDSSSTNPVQNSAVSRAMNVLSNDFAQIQNMLTGLTRADTTRY